ncbi:SAC3 domain-containing protein 1 [Lamellibrachia satsuma]|nr:SAC3 domain-containing protein 1 [Lamellibrachia satsuma]
MCPEGEIKMRESRRLLHKYEILEGTENSNRPKADYKKMVKEYSRPAAGKLDTDSCDLRPPEVLYMTVCYLINNVVPMCDSHWYRTYEYVFDRLRAVRQDMVMQQVCGTEAVHLLEQISNFHIYAGYRLCTEPIATFDPKMNDTHTQECLKRLLCLYQDDDTCRCHMGAYVALYMLFNLASTEAAQWGLELKPQIGSCAVYQTALAMSLASVNNNYVCVLRLSQNLPYLHLCAFHRHLALIERRLLQIMNVGFSSKNLKYSLSDLSHILLIPETETQVLCQQHGLGCSNGAIKFFKGSFKDDVKMQPHIYSFIDAKLTTSAPECLLGQDECSCQKL